MTHLNTDQPIDCINALPGVISTDYIAAVISASIARVRAMPQQPETWRMIKHLRQQLKSFYRIKAARFKHWLRLKLQTDSNWRQRVLDDLGGDSALRRWDKRAAGTPQNKQPLRRSSERRTARTNPARVKTDSTGFYKLAPAVQRNTQRSSSVRTPRSISASFKDEYPNIKPIGLTPDDFRFAGGHSQISMETIDPHALWDAIMAPIHALSLEIDQLDIDMTLANERREKAVLSGYISPANGPAPQGVAARAITAPG